MEKENTLYTEMNDEVKADDWVTAYHVCPVSKAELIEGKKTAGGVDGPNPDIGAPTEKQCVKQVAEERATWAAPTERVVIEFGVGQKPNYKGAPGNVVAVFQIRAKYLRWGSGTEGGWCAYPTAPIVWVRRDKL